MKQVKSSKTMGSIIFILCLGAVFSLTATAEQFDLTYSSYFGDRQQERGRDVVIDGNGDYYIVFNSQDPDPDSEGFPYPGSLAAQVVKFDGSDHTVIWKRWIGGSAIDWGCAIDLDSSGNVYVTGYTESPDFVVTDDSSLQGEYAHFLARFSADGTSMLSTLFSSFTHNLPNVDIAVSGGFAHVTGSLGDDAYVVKYGVGGDGQFQPEWGQSFGGSGWDYGQGIAVDKLGNVYVTGRLASTDMFWNAELVTISGQTDAFMAKFGSDGTRRSFTTIGGPDFGNGSDEEKGKCIAVYEAVGFPDRVYVAGRLSNQDPDFTATPGVYNTPIGDIDGFLAVLEEAAENVFNPVYATYLGGTGHDRVHAVDIDAAGRAYVFGYTSANDVITKNAFQPSYGGGSDGLLYVLDPAQAGDDGHIYSTYLGGKGSELPYGLRVNGNRVFLTGATGSRDFPVVNPVDGSYARDYDAFISIFTWLTPNDPPVVTITSPADGAVFDSEATVNFAGIADDTEDGDISAGLSWTSDIDGAIGTGSSSSSALSDGIHTITASVTDTGGEEGSDSITITVGSPPEPDTIGVASINYSANGPNLQIVCTLDQPVGGAVVSIDLYKDGNKVKSFSGATDEQGVVSFNHKKAGSGLFTSMVMEVATDGYTWDGKTPPNNFTN